MSNKISYNQFDIIDAMGIYELYVDQINGSDENIGNKIDKPLKTLKKAIDSIPTGGKLLVKIIGNYNFNESIFLFNKNVTIKFTDENNNTLTVYNYPIDNSNQLAYYGFYLSQSSISIQKSNIVLTDKIDPNKFWRSGAVGAFFKAEHPGGPNFIHILYSQIRMGDSAGNFCVTGIGDYSIINHLLIEGGGIIRNSGFIYSIQNSYGVGSFSVSGTTLQNGNGDFIDWNSVINGVVFDSDNKPRNLLTNIIL